MIKKIRDLSLTELNLLVAKLEGIEVVIKSGHVAVELKFSPEGPANEFSNDHRTMWQWYEPTNDWSLAGPIILRERIGLIPMNSICKFETLWCNQFGMQQDDNPLVSAMRSYIAKTLGDKIDVSTVSYRTRKALVKMSCMSNIECRIEDAIFVDETIEIMACTNAEAEQLAKEKYADYQFIDATFLRWA